MSQYAGRSFSAPDTLSPVRSWRLLLLLLLLLLPVTVSLAAPEPVHAAGESPTGCSIQGHIPVDTPVCHHRGDHHTGPGLIADKRNLETPASGDASDTGSGAMASPGPRTAFIPGTAPAAPELLSIHADNDVPIYLMTRRFRA